MERPRPGPGEELNHGEVTAPRLAATVILLRDGHDRLEVLLVRRTPKARFLGGAWVFPGGAVGPDDGAGDDGVRAAAIRELREESGIELPGPAELVAFSRWITPAQLTTRFDTWFFLARLPAGERPRIDESEIVDARWFTPAAALAGFRAGEIVMVFPTIRHLEQLSGFTRADELLAYARARRIQPVQPRVVGTAETARILLPGEPGYDATETGEPSATGS
jgi:8-oxo-dGTP pyrophosphatase MutT (NUDIX family)